MDFINISEWNERIEKAFIEAKVNIPAYEKELKTIEEVLTKGLNIEERLMLEEKKKELLDIINDLLNDTSMGYYFLEVQKYLEAMANEKPITISFMKRDRVKNTKTHEITKSFLELASKYNKILKLDIPQINKADKKVSCECGNKNFDTMDNRVHYCVSCGTQIKENIGIKSTYKDIDRVNSVNRYKYTRTVHMRNCVRQFQGKQKVKIPPDCIRDVKDQLYINGISSKINPQHIRTCLQETGWSDQYENFVLIWSMITEKKCPDISALEDDIFKDFECIEREYNTIMVNPYEVRSSFMSYPFVLYHILKRHDYVCNLNFFNMLKSDRISWLNDTMEQIYLKLEWGGFERLGD